MSKDFPVKPGWQSSESWIVLAGHLLGGLAALGLITSADAKNMTDWVSNVVAAAVILITLLWQGANYVKHRSELKQQSAQLAAAANKEEEGG